MNNLMRLIQMVQQQGQQPQAQAPMPMMGEAPSSAPQEMGIASLGEQKIMDPEPMQPLKGPSEKKVGDAEGNFNKAYSLAMGNQGIGSLAGGIAALVLGPKMRKVREQAEGNRIKAQEVQLESEDLSNRRSRQILEGQQSEINKVRGRDALFRIETKSTSNPMEDAKLAGAEFTENGRFKTNMEKLNELTAQGRVNINLPALTRFAPGLISRFGQTYSALTVDALMDDLNKAGQQERIFSGDIAKIREANKAKEGASGDDAFKAWSGAVGNIGRIMTSLTDPALLASPDQVNDIMVNTIIPAANAINEFGVKNKLIKTPDQMLTPRRVIDAVDMYQKGDPSGMQNLMGTMQNLGQQGQIMANKPKTAPDRVKDKKPPLIIDSPGPVPSKKEINTSSALELLGEE